MWLSDGNSKYSHEKRIRILTWGLPPIKTCPGAGECRKFCYALQGRMAMDLAVKAQQRRWQLSQSPEFVSTIVGELSRRKWDMVRLHDTGDFYNRKYLDDWCRIAGAFPHKVFFGYTKNIPLVKSAILPDNIRVVYSMGSKWDDMIDAKDPHSRVFPDRASMESAGYGQSPDILPLSFHGPKREGFVYHGVKLWKTCMAS